MLKDRILAILRHFGLSQAGFAAKIKVNPHSVSLWIKGRSNVQNKSLAKIERAFNINPDWLRNGNGDMFLSINNENDDLDKIIAWLNGLSREKKIWIKFEMRNRFPEYREWLQKMTD